MVGKARTRHARRCPELVLVLSRRAVDASNLDCRSHGRRILARGALSAGACTPQGKLSSPTVVTRGACTPQGKLTSPTVVTRLASDRILELACRTRCAGCILAKSVPRVAFAHLRAPAAS